MQSYIKIPTATSSIAFLLMTTFSNLNFYSSLGISIFIFFCLKFFIELGKTIEIRDLIIIIALLQWIIGPLLKYHISPNDIFYYMAVPEEVYMSFSFWASLLFIAGMYLPFVYKKVNSEYHISKINNILKEHPNVDVVIIGIGVVSMMIEKFTPESFRFFVFLLSGTRFIGLFFLVMGKKKYKWHIFITILFLLFLESLNDAVFHELLLWLIFLFIIIAFLYKFTVRQKLMVLIPIFTLIILIQSVKFYFREEAYMYKGSLNRIGLFTNLVTKELQTGDKTFSYNNLDAAIDRINQGWIVARIMRYTPYYEPFANGETIIAGIEASLVPRFLNPKKAKAGGRDNFERFTGKRLSQNTSMGLSPLGEAYANFGIDGGIIFMFVLGLFYNIYMSVLVKLTKFFPSLILWLPLLFLQVVKAETDFVVVFNHLVKATVLVAMLIFVMRKFTPIKI